MIKDYKITIGLEIHVALKTKTKLFSSSSSSYDAETFSLFDAGVPGIMPVLSEEPVKMALAFAKSINAEIPKVSFFERKHYFYADLPLGYQITQQNNPIMIGGKVPVLVDGEEKNIIIEHAHLECDAAKSIHDKYNEYTAIDLTRCSTPLLEIVSTPCMHSVKEAKAYAQSVCELVKFLDICDGKLEEGSFRVDASISLSKTEKLGTRVEIKNISSFGFLEDALNHEIYRQSEILDEGKQIDMETRLFDEKTLTTKSMRKKETVHEYRYMPDPDISPLVITDEMLEYVSKKYSSEYFKLKSKIYELIKKYDVIVDETTIVKSMGKDYIDLLKYLIEEKESKENQIKLLKYIMFWSVEVMSKVKSEKKLLLEDVKKLIFSDLQAREIKTTLEKYLTSDLSLDDCIPKFESIEDTTKLIVTIMDKYKPEIDKYKSGQEKMLQFLIGKVMSELKGKVQAQTVKDIVLKIIS